MRVRRIFCLFFQRRWRAHRLRWWPVGPSFSAEVVVIFDGDLPRRRGFQRQRHMIMPVLARSSRLPGPGDEPSRLTFFSRKASAICCIDNEHLKPTGTSGRAGCLRELAVWRVSIRSDDGLGDAQAEIAVESARRGDNGSRRGQKGVAEIMPPSAGDDDEAVVVWLAWARMRL